MLNPTAKKFYKTDPDPTSTPHGHVSPFCRFCWNLGLEKKDCIGHSPADCPKLASTECTKCGQMGHTRGFCTSKVCRYCQAIGHIMKDCPHLTSHECLRCGVVGHHESICRMPVCRYCKEAGHVISECPNMTCNECNSTGHTRRTCPYMSHPSTSYQPKWN